MLIRSFLPLGGRVALLWLAMTLQARSAVWQWVVLAPGPASAETNDQPRAFLWIPPRCAHVRAVVVGQHNMQEEGLLEAPRFRAALARLDMAAVWITPPLDLDFWPADEAGERLDAALSRLAERSGYEELAECPVVPVGHSAAAGFPWNFAAWRPVRTLAVISLSGQWPLTEDPPAPPHDDGALEGVPGLVTIGEYEWAEQRARDGARLRAAHPGWPLSMFAEPGGGHFDLSDRKLDFLAFYLEKVAAARLPAQAPANGAATLRPLDARTSGWLVERWRGDQPPAVSPAPVAAYHGAPDDAFWCFDAEHARRVERAQAVDRGKQRQLLGYRQQSGIVAQVPGSHEQVPLVFESLDGGPRFRLTGAFLDEVPAGRPERWTGRSAGAKIAHAASQEKIVIDPICGPVRKLDAETFSICYARLGLTNTKRSPEAWFAATHPGDDIFRRSVQQSLLRVPLTNAAGTPQTIEFPPLPDVPRGTSVVPLAARSSAGLPIDYFVVAGAADVEGDRMRMRPWPPRSRLPAEITVVAWQWGRVRDPQVQTAAPVERTFRVVAAPSDPISRGTP